VPVWGEVVVVAAAVLAELRGGSVCGGDAWEGCARRVLLPALRGPCTTAGPPPFLSAVKDEERLLEELNLSGIFSVCVGCTRSPSPYFGSVATMECCANRNVKLSILRRGEAPPVGPR
jgi:hypothetical protein